ncbi:MAG: DUF2269 domain-containing protein [Actinomycetota bacterium]|nr:DUF2269 domain-containing protein [Actinomycetota bacterium]
MTMTPGLRKLALTSHVISSVGWLGAIVAYLAVAVAAVTSQNVGLVRAAYLVMQFSVWYVIVPLAFASLLTGLIQSLGTAWGLVRHYWVIAKLVLNLVANLVLLGYTQEIGPFAEVAAKPTFTVADLVVLRNPSHVVHSGVALLVVLAATILAVYKPRGMTRYGQRRQREQLSGRAQPAIPVPER